MLVFGSPEANEMAKEIKLLNRCLLLPVRCPSCNGNESKSAECQLCNGDGQMLRSSDGAYYRLNALQSTQWLKSLLLKEGLNRHGQNCYYRYYYPNAVRHNS